MKKFVCMLLCLLLIPELTACGQVSLEPTTVMTTAPAVTAASAETAAPPDPDSLMTAAAAAAENGQIQAAIDGYTAVIRLDHQRMEAFLGRAALYALDPTTLELAETDYWAALNIKPGQEAVYLKLVKIYDKLGQAQKADAILQEAAEVFGSSLLQKALLERRAARFSDEELTAIASQAMTELASLRISLLSASAFKIDKTQSRPSDHKKGTWYLVDDFRVSSLEDLDAFWHKTCAADYPIPELSMYREFDGRLYALFIESGKGRKADLFELDGVYRRDGTSVLLSGSYTCGDGDGSPLPLICRMVLEDDTWKCSGYALSIRGIWEFTGWESHNTTAGDLPVYEVPAETTQPPTEAPAEITTESTEDDTSNSAVSSDPDLFGNTWAWHRGLTNGSFYAIWFYEDGVYYARGVINQVEETGTFEYRDGVLILDGEHYIRDDQSFKSKSSHTGMGGTRYYCSIEVMEDPSALYLPETKPPHP